MNISRRQFMQISAMAGVGAFAAQKLAWAIGQSVQGIRKFVLRLPSLGTSPLPPNEMGMYIPVAVPNRTKFRGVDYYQIQIDDYRQQVHQDLPGPARFMGYADITNGPADFKYLGGVIVAKRGTPVQITFVNRMPDVHPLPIDPTLPGAAGPEVGLPNRAAVHLHGGFVPWVSDGGPAAWVGPDGRHGESFLNNQVIPHALGRPGDAEHYYPNDQSARLMWYHDHAMGLTRLNAYAGIASAYLLYDDVEEILIRTRVLPSLPGVLRYGIPLIIQDKTFYEPSLDSGGAYPGDQARGSLFYPYQYEDAPPQTGVKFPMPPISCLPEYFSDTAMVNGAPYPYLPVEQRHYRFRILNASQSRFYNLQLYYATPNGQEADLTKAGPRIIQIGTESGFLPAPVALNNPPFPFGAQFDKDGNYIPGTVQFNLLLAPAERADIVVDFSKVPTGARLILYNDAPAPFPGGDDSNDYQTGAAIGDTGLITQPGNGPNTRTLMQFQVTARTSAADPASMNLLETAAVSSGRVVNPLPPVDTVNGFKERWLTLNETFDDYGRLIQMLGTTTSQSVDNQGLPFWGLAYDDQPTEVVRANDTEIWHIVNLTGDTHPIHFHLVNVQVLTRQPFDVANYAGGKPTWTGPARKRDPNERGYKETVRMNPGEVTSVVMKFTLPRVPFTVPPSPRFAEFKDSANRPIQGAEYVWHCHILEHEEHDMMRPLVVVR